MAAGQNPIMEQFQVYFQRADADGDGRISEKEALAFFHGSNLPKKVVDQIWRYADKNETGFLGRPEFYNALKLVTVAQSKRELTPNIVEAALHGPVSPKIPPPQIKFATPSSPQSKIKVGVSPAEPSHFTITTQRQPPSSSLEFPKAGSLSVSQPESSNLLRNPIQEKAKVPVLEKHLVDQLSAEEQDSLNKKLQEAKDVEKKVADLEKDIVQAKQMIQFYRPKMEELSLYKRRIDARRNQLFAKVVEDKREAESLTKKYKEKYIKDANQLDTVEQDSLKNKFQEANNAEEKILKYADVIRAGFLGRREFGNGEFLNKDSDQLSQYFDFDAASEREQFWDMDNISQYFDFDAASEREQFWDMNNISHRSRSTTESLVGDKYRIRKEDDFNARLATLANKVEAIELWKLNGIASKPTHMPKVNKSCCSICENMEHSTNLCPMIPIFKEVLRDREANATNTFKKPYQNPYSEEAYNFVPYNSTPKRSFEDTLQRFMESQTMINNQTSEAVNDIKITLTKLTTSSSNQGNGG